MHTGSPVKYKNITMFSMNIGVVFEYFLAHPPKHSGLTVFCQHEHNLVLPGPGVIDLSEDDPVGTVESMLDPTEMYRVRIVNKPRYYYSDVVIEWNRPNVENIERNGVLPPGVAKKIVYAPSLPFAYSNHGDRPLPVMTNFNNNGPDSRRGQISGRLLEVCPGYNNVTDVYDYSGLRDLYSSAKVIVNAHQTWFHHSIEEFRVLPALCRGCIVVSEDVPLRECIPYHEYIVWAPYGELADVTSEVLQHYDHYFEKIHGEHSGLPALLDEMKHEFTESMTRLMDDDEYFSLEARMRRRLLGVASKIKCTIEYQARRRIGKGKGR